MSGVRMDRELVNIVKGKCKVKLSKEEGEIAQVTPEVCTIIAHEGDADIEVVDEQPDCTAPDLQYLDTDQQLEVGEVLKQNQRAFSLHEMNLGHCTIVQHCIDTGKNAPVATRQWPLSHSTRQAIQEEVEKMVELGVVEKCANPWRSPAMLVKKKCGGNRYVIDYRNLNKMLRDDKFPLPRIEEVLESLGGSQYFSSLDCRSGYWQIDVREEDRDKTAYSTGSDTYRFKRMPFGLKTTPATFQRLMHKAAASPR